MPLLHCVGVPPLPAGGMAVMEKVTCPATAPLFCRRKPPCSPPVNEGWLKSGLICSAMLNCQLPSSVSGICELLLEEPLPHAASVMVPASTKIHRLFTYAPPNRGESI